VTDGLTFEFANALVKDFEPESFDVVYSRDCIIHIREKAALFERFFKWLKPGGKLMISDYTCCPDEEKPDEFWTYLADRKYDLRPIEEYAAFIRGAGFDVVAEDQSEWFTSILKMELEKLSEMKDEFLKSHSLKDFEDIEEGWKIKLVRCSGKVQQWSLFQGVKPVTNGANGHTNGQTNGKTSDDSKLKEFGEKRKDVESIDNLNSNQFQKFLDESQYKLNGILRYEKIFGRGFISTGGVTTTTKVLEKIGLNKDDKVLSIGCGIGGGEIMMNKKYGAIVHAIDLSQNMLSVARHHVEKTEID